MSLPPTTIEGWPALSTGRAIITADGSQWLYQPNVPGGIIPTEPTPPFIENYPRATTTGVGVDADGAFWLYHPPSSDGMIDLTPEIPPPANVTLPTITIVSGGGVVGSLIANGNPGTWVPPQTTGYTRRWFSDGVAIPGATATSYTATATDLGNMIRCGVTANGDGGPSEEALTPEVGPIVAAPPLNTVAPVIDGFNVVGATLTCDTGAWTGTPPTTFSFQWTRDGTNIPGATTLSYVIQQADAGATLGCVVTGDNGAGRAAAAAVNPVGIPLSAPVNYMAPLASLNPTYILCTGGEWAPAGWSTMSYQWYAGGEAIDGATGSTWGFAGHEGETAYCAVRVGNAAGQSTPTNTNTVTIPTSLEEDTFAVPKAKRTKKR